jgi:16S rRNA (guanine527-N7)-methyltransferase
MPIRDELPKRAAKAGLALTATASEGLIAYFELLRKWNRKVSLTSLPVEDAGDEAIDRMLIEPVIASRFLPKSDAIVLDVGSGGGSPAIPMKVASPGLSLRMVESKARKAAFLREVVRSLQLDRTIVDAVRFEELLPSSAMLNAFDVVTVRAVRLDTGALTGLQAFMRPGGLLFFFSTASPPDLEGSPMLSSVGSHLLLGQWGSHLHVLRNAVSYDGADVPRGT